MSLFHLVNVATKIAWKINKEQAIKYMYTVPSELIELAHLQSRMSQKKIMA